MCPQSYDILDGKLLLCPKHESLDLKLDNRRYALYNTSPECGNSCEWELVGEAEALKATSLTEEELLETIWRSLSDGDPNRPSSMARETQLMCEERLGWGPEGEKDLPGFEETTVTDPQKAVDILFGQAIKAVPKVVEQRIPPDGLWGSPPVQGSEHELKALLLDELRSYLSRDTFDSFIIRANPGDDFAQVMVFLGDTFAPMRLWRTRESFFACGGPGFGANRVVEADSPDREEPTTPAEPGPTEDAPASVDERLRDIEDINGFIFSERDRLMAGERSQDDSTMVVWDLLQEYQLYRGMILFADFETAKSVLMTSLEEGSGFAGAVAGLSRTSDGAAMVIGGDLRDYHASWYKMIEVLNKGRDELGITEAFFFEMGASDPSAQSGADISGEPVDKGVPHFEVGLPEGDGVCSDPACPCDDEVIPRGEGYLFIPEEMVEFRRDALGHADVRAKIGRISEEGRQRGSMVVIDPAVYNPVLMCRRAAELRGLDLDVAARDAKTAWETDWAPLSPTPLAKQEPAPPAREQTEPQTDESRDQHRTFEERAEADKAGRLGCSLVCFAIAGLLSWALYYMIAR